jgi:D-3-phosphoglycerate dehydrogenase
VTDKLNLCWESPTTEAVEDLILDLVEWVHRKERSYRETMDAWRTSCPRLPVWEEANDRGLVETISYHGRMLVRATPTGLTLLASRAGHDLKR